MAWSILNITQKLARQRQIPRCCQRALSVASPAGASEPAKIRIISEEDDNFQTTPAGILPVTQELDILNSIDESEGRAAFRLMDLKGNPIEGAVLPELDRETATKWYQHMVKIQVLDDVLYNVQRQGRISFYMQSSGEEATHIGSATALKDEDVVFTQYREVGVLLWRNFSIQQICDQCFSNSEDLGKGRQMPVHYGSRALNFQTISSPLATQLPQAVGAAIALKRDKKDAISICYFGEGAASEGDFHAAMNFAATLEAPIVFFCRNNGYAISTPVQDQFRGDGIVSRAAGYGMRSIRVDGNDALAVHQATAEARKVAIDLNRPVLIEAMTYRRGHHSTSDDSTRYRSAAEIQHWGEKFNPVVRFKQHLELNEWWDDDQDTILRDKIRVEVLTALEVAENREKPHWDELFNDVYEELPQHLKEQKEALREHMAKYPDRY
jgi:2-oxoisovalerate dehydrogenase E1 component alpha subunit